MKEKRQEPHCAQRAAGLVLPLALSGQRQWHFHRQNSETTRSKSVQFIYLFYYLMGCQNFKTCINFNSTYEN